ncbi:MAG: carbamoyl-phosphate synthase large subunit, partial [Thermodesulfobacteriota bacterium]
EPITPDMVEKIIAKERPDALLPTLGGQTALNVSVRLAEDGILKEHGVEMIGAGLDAIKKAEDRELFKKSMKSINLDVPESVVARSMDEALKAIESMGYPVVIRPSFTLGGTGGGIAYNREEFEDIVKFGLEASPYSEVLIEESVIGWKEFELEVMRDKKDNVVVICSIENLDPMGVHTGDSITVAPAQTLTDKEYQIMRDAAIRVIREIGVETGGSNIQFSINPYNGRMCIIEMNPRVSRSSALASKATGYPIAKIAAKLAVGYTLDEISNDITRKTPASFEPTIDYVVVKIPRFTFEKFPDADQTLTTQMKSVGEVMSIGRTFKEALQKAIRSLEIGSYGFESRIWAGREEDGFEPTADEIGQILDRLKIPNWERLWYIADAFRAGLSVDDIHEVTNIDSWFLNNIRELVEFEEEIRSRVPDLGPEPDKHAVETLDSELLRCAKEFGFSDKRLGKLSGITEEDVRDLRRKMDILPVYKTVDTCAAEFEAYTPYLYSTYERPFYKFQGSEKSDLKNLEPATWSLQPISECESNPTSRKKVLILGSGPNRIGQGIEFDYCCVHASLALKEEGIESIMINCNPETVSTDYDTSDRLYFEPLALEDVTAVIEKEEPYGVIVQLGGQTPLKLAVPLERKGIKILGTPPDSIDEAEDRGRFDLLLDRLGLKKAESGVARSIDDAVKIAGRIGYPVMVRPSYVLGGRAMVIVYEESSLISYMTKAVEASPEHPVLLDKFLDNAVEVDVDCISDGRDVVIGGIMEHIEEAGVHSGDSACSIPPYSLDADVIEDIRRQTISLARELSVIGLMNIQFAVRDGSVYILEVNPRASRTVPFVSKTIGRPLAKIATKIMLGRTLRELDFTGEVFPEYTSVKEAVFPFIKFPGVDTILGPEMKSTGEVMGIDVDFGRAFAKAQIAAGNTLPLNGNVFISVKDEDKLSMVLIAKEIKRLGFGIMATKGTASFFQLKGIDSDFVYKVGEGRPNIVDRIKSGEVAMVINTSFGAKSVADSYSIRRSSLVHGIPYFTTVAGAKAAIHGIAAIKKEGLKVKTIHEFHK